MFSAATASGEIDDFAGFICVQLDTASENSIGFDSAVNFSAAQFPSQEHRSVLQLGANGQVRFFRGWQIELGFDKGMPHGNRAARGKDDFLPETHVLVGGHGIPIDEGDSQFTGFWRGDRQRDNIFARLRERRPLHQIRSGETRRRLDRNRRLFFR